MRLNQKWIYEKSHQNKEIIVIAALIVIYMKFCYCQHENEEIKEIAAKKYQFNNKNNNKRSMYGE